MEERLEKQLQDLSATDRKIAMMERIARSSNSKYLVINTESLKEQRERTQRELEGLMNSNN